MHNLPLSLYLRSRAKLWCTLQLRGQVHSSCFSSTLFSSVALSMVQRAEEPEHKDKVSFSQKNFWRGQPYCNSFCDRIVICAKMSCSREDVSNSPVQCIQSLRSWTFFMVGSWTGNFLSPPPPLSRHNSHTNRLDAKQQCNLERKPPPPPR